MVGVKLTRRAAEKTSKAVRKILGTEPTSGGRKSKTRTLPGRKVQGRLNDALTAPVNGWTDPTTVEMTVYKPDPDNSGEMIETDEVIEVVNRDPTLTADEGAYCKAEFLQGEWSFYWVGC